ncbi:LOW QUALITY PROTEIN: GDSL esterase/lipase At1g71250 [Dendrobium catenatum]|uniref:LOW QUALITY PROTEIN: GDSL esterase/lipase At1g71250 n=1 Tax=Dendrobium catenatum TaxID=906689 RepID=UPI0010A0AE0B|nr:LOW QUALITY PROTEIN: GDSL esterase/lipase At1g71250 [Dendrobium catenatum]
MASLFFFFCQLLLSLGRSFVAGADQVPAMFVFGDSLIDPGNNNQLLTLAKANFRPHGIDFQEGTTGRFCNGGTVADHLGKLFFYILGYQGKRIPMDEQLQNFNATIEELSTMLLDKTQDHIRRSLFLLAPGSNDYINNYLLPLSKRRSKYTPEAFANLLIQQFGRQLKVRQKNSPLLLDNYDKARNSKPFCFGKCQDLYDLGARKFVIANISPIGCIPNQLTAQDSDTGACVESVNLMASHYNRKLKEMVDQYNAQLKESTFLYWDAFSFGINVIQNYANYGNHLNPLKYITKDVKSLMFTKASLVIHDEGFKSQNTACCGGGKWKGQIICLPVLSPCQNRSEYVFWDPYHPTDAFNVIASKDLYQGNLQASFPRNVQQLVQS